MVQSKALPLRPSLAFPAVVCRYYVKQNSTHNSYLTNTPHSTDSHSSAVPMRTQ